MAAPALRNIRCAAFNPISATETVFIPDAVISTKDGYITALTPFNDYQCDWEDYRGTICLPGFIDLHVHLSQYRIRGIYRPALLPWLNHTVFPEEEKSRDPEYACQLSRDFFAALWRRGTTYSVQYTAPYREAADIAFAVAREMGVQAKIGMTMMDMNSPEGLQQSTD